MKREALDHLLHVFDEGGAYTVTIDAMQLQLYPAPGVRVPWPERAALARSKKTFKESVGATEKRLRGHRVLKLSRTG